MSVQLILHHKGDTFIVLRALCSTLPCRFTTPPTLTVAVEFLPYHTLTWVEDPREPGGRRLLLTGFVDEIVKYLARAMNFRYRYVVSPDGTFGTRLPDGSWTGLMGMVVREEADFAPGPFIINPQRYEAAQAAAPYSGSNIRILGGLKGLEMDPWGFLFPLTPLVWTVTLVMLVGVHFVLQVLPSCLLGKRLCSEAWLMDPSHSMRVLLQQDVVWPVQWLWWERLLLGLWMLTTLVLTKSYAGNLMSLLAVRYVPQPFQTIHDVLDHPSVSVISQKHSSYEQTLMDVKSGVLRKVADLQQEGRLEFHTLKQLPRSIDTLVRGGTHVHVGLDINLRSQIALDFSKNGRCGFYISRDGMLPLSASMMIQKTSPLVHGFDQRLLLLVAHGLRLNWIEHFPNSTECNNVPKRIAVSTHISISNIWGLFAVLAGGMAAALVVWCAELLIRPPENTASP
ncbi:probable glutamate receptor [Portunus trituberculatus]|uniref:probable glutamate receptor n=1 Tax=Portunus trituberculatus TaxID=210409 RepID=UPI001E1CDA1C|nr:probable glutamate receptor [Portunus trituberculatus]